MIIDTGLRRVAVTFGPRHDAWSACAASVEVTCGEFRGRSPNVVFSAGALTAFLEEVRRVERGESDKAQLLAQDPRIFALTISVTDPAGRLQAHGHLVSSDEPRSGTDLEYRFPLDRRLLPAISP